MRIVGGRFRGRSLTGPSSGAEARAAIRANVESLGVGGITRVFRQDARKLGAAPAGERFGLAFLDPPYNRGLAEPCLAALAAGRWLAPGALAIIEESSAATLTVPAGFAEEETRLFGETKVVILRADADA